MPSFFDGLGVHRLAPLVQLVERRSPKPDVEGSSPSGRGKSSFWLPHVGEANVQFSKAEFGFAKLEKLIDFVESAVYPGLIQIGFANFGKATLQLQQS